jgi:C4-dicarboxylate-specific signal transduction histidine kinase
MGELTASLAHEINQPLTAIMSNGVAGLRWLKRETPNLAEALDAFQHIVQDAARAGEVMRGIRALAMKSGPQLNRLDINDVIQEVLALTRGELHRHDVALHTELATGGRSVLGDRVQLQQVLLNLILNGIDAMKTVSHRARELRVSTAFSEPVNLLVAVEDTGTGLDPAIAPRIFEPFFTTKPDGLGMGLSICRSIVDAHGGELWASPRAPCGTALRFTLPLAG